MEGKIPLFELLGAAGAPLPCRRAAARASERLKELSSRERKADKAEKAEKVEVKGEGSGGEEEEEEEEEEGGGEEGMFDRAEMRVQLMKDGVIVCPGEVGHQDKAYSVMGVRTRTMVFS